MKSTATKTTAIAEATNILALSDFFPQDAQLLSKQLHYYLQYNWGNTAYTLPADCPRAIIVPHAAYCYSGAVAGKAYAALMPHTKTIDTILLIAPSHYQFFKQPITSTDPQLDTPIGAVNTLPAIVSSTSLAVDDQAISQEYAIRVQLPFIKTVLPKSTVMPVLVSRESEVLDELIQEAWHDPQTLIIISSDLYHYLPGEYGAAYGRQICQAIEQQESALINQDAACGYMALRSLLKQVNVQQGYITTLSLQHSGNVQQQREGLQSVVGYGAFSVYG